METKAKKTKKYAIYSPDGFTIERTPYYRSIKAAMAAFDMFLQRYERQGYYSSPTHGRISLQDLPDFCQFSTI